MTLYEVSVDTVWSSHVTSIIGLNVSITLRRILFMNPQVTWFLTLVLLHPRIIISSLNTWHDFTLQTLDFAADPVFLLAVAAKKLQAICVTTLKTGSNFIPFHSFLLHFLNWVTFYLFYPIKLWTLIKSLFVQDHFVQDKHVHVHFHVYKPKSAMAKL